MHLQDKQHTLYTKNLVRGMPAMQGTSTRAVAGVGEAMWIYIYIYVYIYINIKECVPNWLEWPMYGSLYVNF